MENKALVLDLVEWVAERPRAYADVMEAWRTSCPRLTIWEDAVDHGFVVRVQRDGAGLMVDATAAGRAFLIAEGRAAAVTSLPRLSNS
jgi:hypothetical protein